MDDNIISQLSIFVNNEPGRLAHIASVLKECGINMRAFNLAESTEFGILRAIVDKPDEAFEKLKATGIIVKKTDVIGVVIQATSSTDTPTPAGPPRPSSSGSTTPRRLSRS